MKELKLTSPFTGQQFNAIDFDDSIIIINPLTGDSYSFKKLGNAITIPLELFNYKETVSFSEAARILEVSRPRITEIAQKDIIPFYRLGNKKVFLKSDVLKYKELRKLGRPNKE